VRPEAGRGNRHRLSKVHGGCAWHSGSVCAHILLYAPRRRRITKGTTKAWGLSLG
jgi:hypothetical protein